MLNADQILPVLWKRRLTFLLTFALILGGVAAATFTLPKVYSTTAYLIVNPAKTSGSAYENTQITQQLTKTFAELLQTPNVANRVAQRLPASLPRTGRALLPAITVTPVQQSSLIEISAEARSPADAQTIANTYASVFTETAGSFSDASARVTVAEPAALAASPSRPKPKLYLLVGALLAALIAAAAAMTRHRLDQRLEITDSSTELLGLPVIGRIPVRASSGDFDVMYQEAFRLILANLSFVRQGGRPSTLAIVSAGPGEGKSSCCIGIAGAAADMGTKTVLVEGDLRRPSLSDRVPTARDRRSGGLSTFLVSPVPLALDDVVLPAQDRSGLHLVPSGPIPPNPSALLSSKRVLDFTRRAMRIFDLVVYDTPPFAAGADASLVAAGVEGVVLVVDATRTKRTAALHAIDQLERTRANVLGVVINRVPSSISDYYGYTSDEARHAVDEVLGDPVNGKGAALTDGDSHSPTAEPVIAERVSHELV